MFIAIQRFKYFVNDEYVIDVYSPKEDPLKYLTEKHSKDIPSDFEFLDKD